MCVMITLASEKRVTTLEAENIFQQREVNSGVPQGSMFIGKHTVR